MDGWHELINILVLLTAALILGTIAEQLRQSAIIGYLLAGMLVGPNGFRWVGTAGETQIITEMGAALLLFTIGLEFSFRRLVRLGSKTALTGILQIVITCAVGFAIARWLGVPPKTAFVIGAAISLSSTASVFRLFSDYTMMDSLHGRVATGVLLLQDMAVVPFVLIITAMAGTASTHNTLHVLARVGLTSIVSFGVLFVVMNYIVPKALNLKRWTKNRELPILLAVVLAVGSAMGAHQVGISPAFGAFLSGMLLAESPFATQILADIGSVRAVLVTLFFAAVGLFADPSWIADNILLVAAATILVIALKTFIISIVMYLLRYRFSVAIPTGLSISQIGEFSFVIASIAITAGLLNQNEFKLIVSATVVTLLLSPYLVILSPKAGLLVESMRERKYKKKTASLGLTDKRNECELTKRMIIVVGFGPAGRRVVDSLSKDFSDRIVVIDINPNNAEVAKAYGAAFLIGDAGSVEVLEHAGIRCAEAVVVTLPDPEAARNIILLCKDLSPNTGIVSRVRYDIYEEDILKAGPTSIVNEEYFVGLHLAEEAMRIIRDGN